MCFRLLTRTSRRKRPEPVARGLLTVATGALVTAMTRNGVRRLLCASALGVGNSRGHSGFVFDGCSCLCREKLNETIREMVSHCIGFVGRPVGYRHHFDHRVAS